MLKNILLFFSAVTFLLLLGGQQVFAVNAPEDLRVTSASDSELYLDWADVADAVGYYIYYGTQSGEDSSYEVEGIDLIEKSEFTLSNLQPDTLYYIAVTAADDSIMESDFSNEISHSTLSSGSEVEAVSLRIEQVNPIDETSIEMTFSKNLDQSANAVREFILENKESREEIFISLSEVDQENPNRLIALLESELEEDTEYELTVLDIQDEDGGSITLGIDAFTTFVTQTFEDDVDMSSAGPEQDETEVTEDNPQQAQEDIPDTQQAQEDVSDVEQNTQEDNENIDREPVQGNNAGENISLDDNTTVAAGETEKLPQAGPEHWILVFLAFLLAGGLYYKNRK